MNRQNWILITAVVLGGSLLISTIVEAQTLRPQNQQQDPRNSQTGNRSGQQLNPQSRNPQQQTPANSVSNTTVIQPRQPFPDLTDEHKKYVDQLLTVWEQRSAQIKRYEFTFERWIYSPEYCKWRDPANNRLAACTLARGTVRYQAPDKGMYEVSQAWKFDGVEEVKDQNGKLYQKAKYAEIKDDNNKMQKEKWICDGSSIFEYDYKEKRIYETKLPSDMRGEGLKNSPLPFLFGVKAEEIKQRYWVRVRPQNNNTIFVLEAYPKRIDDARNYKKIDLVLSRDPYLPVSLTMYAPNFDAQKNQSYTVFQFKNRKVDGALSQFNQWLGNFVKPTPPNLLWKVIERKPLSQSNTDSARRQEPPRQNK